MAVLSVADMCVTVTDVGVGVGVGGETVSTSVVVLLHSVVFS